MTRHIRPSDLAVMPEEGRAYRIGRAPVEAARESDDLLAPRLHARHSHRVLVRLRARVAEERLRYTLGRAAHQRTGRVRAHVRVDDVRVEEETPRLLPQSLYHARVAMARRAHCVAAVQVQKALALASLDPTPLAAHGRERKLLISRELILLLARGYLFKLGHRLCSHNSL